MFTQEELKNLAKLKLLSDYCKKINLEITPKVIEKVIEEYIETKKIKEKEPEILIGNTTKIIEKLEKLENNKNTLRIHIQKYRRIKCPCSQEYINRINCHYCEFNTKEQNENYITCKYNLKILDNTFSCIKDDIKELLQRVEK